MIKYLQTLKYLQKVRTINLQAIKYFSVLKLQKKKIIIIIMIIIIITNFIEHSFIQT